MTAVSWQPIGTPGDYAAQEFMDWSTAASFTYEVSDVIQGEIRVTPKFLIIDNLQSALPLTIELNTLQISVPAATRNRIVYPEGMRSFTISSLNLSGVSSVIVSETPFVEDVSNQTAVVTPPSPGGGGGPLKITLVTATGNHIMDASTTRAIVEVVGRGGSGASNGGSGTNGGGGGGGGGYARKLYSSITGGLSCAIVIGATCSFTDGVDAISASTGSNGSTGSTGGGGGAGGSGTGGDINLDGGHGTSGAGVPNAGGDGGATPYGMGDGNLYGSGGEGGGGSGAAGAQGCVIITEFE